MWKKVLCVVASAITLFACGPAKKGLFTDRRSDHEKYGDRIKEAGLEKSTMAVRWFAAAERSLIQPLNITVPYRETGYFAADKPSASGYLFAAKKGERLKLSIAIVPDTLKDFFGELWRPADNRDEAELVAAIDSTRTIVHDVEEDGNYLIRIQPPLLEAIEYNLSISTGPSLAFPVSEGGNPKMISFWSDPRDGGARKHEGVDIGAAFRTPAIASADGVVNRVMENRLGGKVVFLRPEGKAYSLYYAHLDSQIVSTGDVVKTGQILGLVGTTGNARGTPPHLHFGIYGWGGAVDPLPFIDNREKRFAPLAVPLERIGKWVRITSNTKLSTAPKPPADSGILVRKGVAAFVNGAADSYVKLIFPDGSQGYVSNKFVTESAASIENAAGEFRLLDRPQPDAPAITTIASNTKYSVLGSFGNFDLVSVKGQTGWLLTE